MHEEPLHNPYSPPMEIGELPREAAANSDGFERRSWPKSLGIWSIVCVVSAMPSFGWAIGTIATQQAGAMCVGILIFICGYTFADQLTQSFTWRRNESIRITLKIGYISRMVISIIFPVGGFLDMFCGIFSVSIAGAVLGQEPVGEGMPGFAATLLITLLQGVILNIVLAAYMVIVFGFVVLARRGKNPIESTKPPFHPTATPPD